MVGDKLPSLARSRAGLGRRLYGNAWVVQRQRTGDLTGVLLHR